MLFRCFVVGVEVSITSSTRGEERYLIQVGWELSFSFVPTTRLGRRQLPSSRKIFLRRF